VTVVREDRLRDGSASKNSDVFTAWHRRDARVHTKLSCHVPPQVAASRRRARQRRAGFSTCYEQHHALAPPAGIVDRFKHVLSPGLPSFPKIVWARLVTKTWVVGGLLGAGELEQYSASQSPLPGGALNLHPLILSCSAISQNIQFHGPKGLASKRRSCFSAFMCTGRAAYFGKCSRRCVR